MRHTLTFVGSAHERLHERAVVACDVSVTDATSVSAVNVNGKGHTTSAHQETVEAFQSTDVCLTAGVETENQDCKGTSRRRPKQHTEQLGGDHDPQLADFLGVTAVAVISVAVGCHHGQCSQHSVCVSVREGCFSSVSESHPGVGAEIVQSSL